MQDVKLTRFLQGDTLTERKEYRLNLESLEKINTASLVLYPGDTIFIDHTGWLTVRDVFSVFTTVAIITSAIAQVIIASSR